jgi:hypothetical protein
MVRQASSLFRENADNHHHGTLAEESLASLFFSFSPDAPPPCHKMSEDLAFTEHGPASIAFGPRGWQFQIINKKKSSYPAPEFSLTSWLDPAAKVTKASDRQREIII